MSEKESETKHTDLVTKLANYLVKLPDMNGLPLGGWYGNGLNDTNQHYVDIARVVTPEQPCEPANLDLQRWLITFRGSDHFAVDSSGAVDPQTREYTQIDVRQGVHGATANLVTRGELDSRRAKFVTPTPTVELSEPTPLDEEAAFELERLVDELTKRMEQ